MTTGKNRSTVQYRINPLMEKKPQRGDVLHACGLTNWHMVVQKIGPTSLQEDGTMTLQMVVDRSDIGKGEQPCALCGVVWLTDLRHP